MLVVEADGALRYLVGNGWPTSPPFDEIGEYAGRLEADQVERIQALVAEVERHGLAGQDRARSADAGVLRLAVEPGGWEVAWSPHDPDPALLELRRALRLAITAAREMPVATMRVELQRSRHGLVLRITNRGRRPFQGSLHEVLLAQDDPESADAATDPIALYGRAEPARLRAHAPGVPGPGQQESLGLDWLPATRGTVVRGWVQARWVASVPPEPPAEIDGWMLLQPLAPNA